jgi:hypothetical protein
VLVQCRHHRHHHQTRTGLSQLPGC